MADVVHRRDILSSRLVAPLNYGLGLLENWPSSGERFPVSASSRSQMSLEYDLPQRYGTLVDLWASGFPPNLQFRFYVAVNKRKYQIKHKKIWVNLGSILMMLS